MRGNNLEVYRKLYEKNSLINICESSDEIINQINSNQISEFYRKILKNYEEPTVKDRVKSLIKERKFTEAQRLYFEDVNNKRRGLIRL